jgi:hypothetical protein
VGGESVWVTGSLLLGYGVGLDVGGEGCGEVGELLGAGVADARELVVDTGLDLELDVLGTSAVGLFGVVLLSITGDICLWRMSLWIGRTSGFDWSDSIKLWLKRTGLSLRRVSVYACTQWLVYRVHRAYALKVCCSGLDPPLPIASYYGIALRLRLSRWISKDLRVAPALEVWRQG